MGGCVGGVLEEGGVCKFVRVEGVGGYKANSLLLGGTIGLCDFDSDDTPFGDA